MGDKDYLSQMIKNYFKVAFRNFRKSPVFSAINVFGLSIGLTSCLLIALYIRHELSYDRFQANGDRLARVIMEYRFNGGGQSIKGNFTSTKVAPVFRRTFPEVVSATRMTEYSRVVGFGDKLFTEPRFMYADSSFFDLFSFPILQGNPHTALSGAGKVMLTRSAAKKYFGKQDPLGKILRVGIDSSPYVITGIMADCPSNSQIKYDFLASFSSLQANQEESYWDANYTTYLLLRDQGSLSSLQGKIHPFMKKEMAGQGANVDFWLEPFVGIHLHSEFDGFEPNNSITNIYILAGIALLIMVIACSTYINLSTARSLERAREVGVRKVVGARKNQLFWQFIGESSLVCLVSACISLATALLVLPWFNQLTDKQLSAASLFSLPFLLLFVVIAALVSLLAGSYPALILTRFQPVKVLKGSFKNTRSGKGLQRSLIVFQFVISVFLIVSTFIMQEQLHYIQHKKLGYDRDHVLVLPMNGKMMAQISLIKAELLADPDILSISRCTSTPVSIGGGYNMRSSIMPEKQQLAVTADAVDEDFIRTTGLQLVAGSDLVQQDIRDVSYDRETANQKNFYHFILNESAARQLGWTPEKAIGQRMFMDESRPGIVKGVVKDFHFASLHRAIGPLILFPELRGWNLLLKLSGQHLPQVIARLETKWKQLVPYMPFEYRFLDDDYNKLYAAELRLGRVMNIFSLVAIVLACLGLFGLSSYAAKQRVKEIGIRKILGASLGDLMVILSGDFVKLAAVAVLIAVPLSWWAMFKWLQGFSYRTGMDWGIFVLAALLTLLIALLTVSIQAMRTAMLNPVKNLRSE
jgi:putative ABC transport system permease protein